VEEEPESVNYINAVGVKKRDRVEVGGAEVEL